MPVHLKVKWVLHNITTILPLIVTIVFWSLLYPGMKESLTGMRFYVNLQVHGINSVVALLDFFVSAVPFRIYHFLHPLSYGLLYVLFSVIYSLSGGMGINGSSYIYFFLDWNARPLLALGTCTGLLIFLAFVHVLLAYLKELQTRGAGLCPSCCRYANLNLRHAKRLDVDDPHLPSSSKCPADSSEGVWNRSGYINDSVTDVNGV